MYLLSRYLLEKIITPGKKVLIIVPSIQLVTQTSKDFMFEYPDDDFVQADEVFGGSKRNPKGNVVIANIDSAIERDSDFFKDFEAVFFDEAHKLSTVGYQKIFEFLTSNNLKQVFACSGSFHTANTIEDWTAESIAGPVMLHVGTKDLIDGGQLTPVEIVCCKLNHKDLATRVAYYTDKTVLNEAKRFGGELNFFRSLNTKFEFISTVAASLEFNQLILVKSVEYARKFVKHLKEKYPHKHILLVVGEVSASVRDEIKIFTENNIDVIIVATYGTMATGISIKNLGGLHFAEAPKSFIWVRQSIGRILRLHPSKDRAYCFDYSDHIEKPQAKDLFGIKSKFRKTISSTHLNDRIKIYIEQQFPFSIKEIDL